MAIHNLFNLQLVILSVYSDRKSCPKMPEPYLSKSRTFQVFKKKNYNTYARVPKK